MKNKTYDRLKTVALLVLPIIITFYGAVATAWNIPYTEQILVTLGAVQTALGSLVKGLSSRYNKKQLKEGNANENK